MTDQSRPDHKRWIVTLYYRSEAAKVVDVEHHIEELGEIEDIVEHGPDWNTIIEGRIRLNPNRRTAEGLTIEESQRR